MFGDLFFSFPFPHHASAFFTSYSLSFTLSRTHTYLFNSIQFIKIDKRCQLIGFNREWEAFSIKNIRNTHMNAHAYMSICIVHMYIEQRLCTYACDVTHQTYSSLCECAYVCIRRINILKSKHFITIAERCWIEREFSEDVWNMRYAHMYCTLRPLLNGLICCCCYYCCYIWCFVIVLQST